MPLFSRRRLHSFLADVESALGVRNVSSLANRLDSLEPQQVLSAEAELATTWALSKVGPLEYEPSWWQGERRPDIVTEHLFPGLKCALEITSLGDGQSDEELMRWQSNLLATVANKAKRRSGKYLYFEFLPERGYRSGRYVNRLRGERGKPVDENELSRFSDWIASQPSAGATMCLDGDDIFVKVAVLPVAPERNYRSAKIEGFTEATKNGIYYKLRDKLDQLRNSHFTGIRALFLWDAGMETISRSSGPRNWEPIVEYAEVIRRFFHKHPNGLDAIFVISARELRSNNIFSYSIYPPRDFRWTIEPFCSQKELDLSRLDQAFACLPAPKLTPIAAKQSVRAGWFEPGSEKQYRGLQISGGPNLPNEFRFSAKALADFVGGRLTEAEFREYTGLVQPRLESMTSGGRTLTDIKFESGGIDSDDDTVVLEFGFDFALRPFKRD